MEKKFNVDFLSEAIDFMESLNEKEREKIYYNARKAQIVNDSEIFKKLNEEIWEFRTLFNKKHYRLLAFWDNTDIYETLVLATHGFVKKTQKTPINEIERAEKIRKQYFEQKNK
jgi:phage-related protein